MKRIGTVIGILLVVAGAAFAVNATRSDPATASSDGGGKTIRLTLLKGFFHPVDQPPQGESPGDAQVFGGKLLSHGHRRGRVQAYCVVVSSSNQECSFTYGLRGGQIAALVGYGKGLSGNKASRDPIVGGNGDYAGARGEISGREVGPRKDQLVFHLLG